MLYLLGMGICHPETIITNKFLEDLDIGTSAEWIDAKIGIQTRVSTLPLDYIRETRNVDPREGRRVASMNSTDMGAKAVSRALAAAQVQPEEVGMLICNCSTPSSLAPSESTMIAANLGLDTAAVQVFDVFSACPAFALHLDYLANFQETRLPEIVVGVCTSAFTQVVNYNDRTDGAIWGDGAAAYVLSTKRPGKVAVTDTSFTADPLRAHAVVVDRFGHFHQDGRAVRDFSVRQTVRMLKRIEADHEVDWQKDVFIGHQANRTMLEQIRRNRRIPPDNHWFNVTYLGNQGAAGAPAALAQSWDKIIPGQKIAVAVLGAGLSWGAALLEGT